MAKKIIPTENNGLIKIKFLTGEEHEYIPSLAKKLVEAKAAQYI